MKKSLLFASLLILSVFVVVQYASSSSENKATPGQGCQLAGQQAQPQQPNLTAEEQQKLDTFLAETVELRKELAEKQAAFEKFINTENPDPAKAAMLTNEYYQLRDFLQKKAVQAGIAQPKGGCNGCRGKGGVACNRNPAPKNIEKTN